MKRETGETGERLKDRGGRKRETGIGRERERKRNFKYKKIMEFYLVVVHSAERSEARHWIVFVVRQVSCYNPLSCFNPVTEISVASYYVHMFIYLQKTKKFGCVGRGDLTSLFFSKVVKY